MKAILFVAHGSRNAKGIEEIKQFTHAVKERMDSKIMELCFLEFAQPSIQEGIYNCVKKGCTKLAIIPLLLTDAVHAKEDIPNEIEIAKSKFPKLVVRYGNPIGIHQKMYKILLSRLNETNVIIDQTTAVILVAKGSRIEQANNDLRILTKEFSNYCEASVVKTAFLSMTFPKFHDVIEQCIEDGATKIVVLPYILFHGLILRKIGEIINNYKNAYPNYTFVTGDYLGFHSLMYDIIKERVEDVLEKNTGVDYE